MVPLGRRVAARRRIATQDIVPERLKRANAG